MTDPRQSIHFTTSFDGTRIAWAVSGKGPPLLRMPHWMSHLEYDWISPLACHQNTALTERHTLVRFDTRGCGLSDRDVADISFEACMRDVQAVTDAAGLDRFAVVGTSGGAMLGIALAARQPERVTRMVLHGSACRGRLRRNLAAEEMEKVHLLAKLIEVGWGSDEPAFRQVFSALFIPGGTAEQWRSYSERMRIATSPHNAARIFRMWNEMDASDMARQVRCPTLVTHSLRDAIQPYEEGRRTEALIPGAEFVTLDSASHIPLEHEPAWQQQFVGALRRFLPVPQAAAAGDRTAGFSELSERERQVLELIAQGIGNDDIAQRLHLSSKTVGNHITSIFAKVGVSSRAQAIVRARDAGYGSAVH